MHPLNQMITTSEYSLHDEAVYKKLLSSKKFIKRGKGLITGTGRVVERKNNMYKIHFKGRKIKARQIGFQFLCLRQQQGMRKKKAKGKANNFASTTLGAQDQAQKQQQEQTSDKNVDFEMSSEVADSVDYAIMKNAHEVFNTCPPPPPHPTKIIWCLCPPPHIKMLYIFFHIALKRKAKI